MARHPTAEIRTPSGLCACVVTFRPDGYEVMVVTNLGPLGTPDRASVARSLRIACAEHGYELTPQEAFDELFGRCR